MIASRYEKTNFFGLPGLAKMQDIERKNLGRVAYWQVCGAQISSNMLLSREARYAQLFRQIRIFNSSNC